MSQKAYIQMALKLQTIEVEGVGTVAKLKEGKPLYIEDTNNTEVTLDAEANKVAINRLNSEAKARREAAEAAEAKLAAFSGIEDPEAARRALETVANLAQGDLVTAGKVEELKAGVEQATKQKFVGQITGLENANKQLTETVGKLTSTLNNEKLTNAFATSSYLKDKVIIAPTAIQKIFADNFKVEDGKLVAYHSNGQKVFSQQKPTEEPSFDEAIEMIIGESTLRDQLLKGSGNQGGGGDGGNGGSRFRADEKKITRTDFETLNPMARAQKMREGYSVVDA